MLEALIVCSVTYHTVDFLQVVTRDRILKRERYSGPERESYRERATERDI